jgi:peptidoglycan/xylan/chitin deacetylase (PgdA/CDA1 family)
MVPKGHEENIQPFFDGKNYLVPDKVMKENSATYILTFHGLGHPERALPAGEDRYWLDPSFFEAILDCLKERLDVGITFDDANSSDFKIALPALLKRRLRATFFMVSERIDQPGFVTSDQLRALAHSGMVIGSHGTQHRRWAQLGTTELNDELNVSRNKLEAILGKPVREAACPFGSYNRRVLCGLKAAGYERVYTSDQGPAKNDEWVSARNTIVRNDTLRDVQNVLESTPRGLTALLRISKLTLKQWL